MIDIVLLTCLLNTSQCQMIRIKDEESVNSISCILTAQAKISNYIKEYPKWVVKKYWCVPAGKDL